METQRPLRLPNSLFVGLVLVFFSGIGFCIHSSAVSSEVGSCDPNYDDSDSKISAFCSFKKYIMQSYYEKYENLLDSDFQDFIGQELPFGMCEVLPHDLSLVVKLSILHRNLIGHGSHRHLTSSIRVNIKPESISELPTHHCKVIIIERLPSGVFADPFELQHLLQRGVYSNIAVFGDTNLESPSFLSNRSAVEVHMDIGRNLFLRHAEEFNINVEIPLHARYPPLDENGYSEVKFGVPDLFMRCSVEGKSHDESCLYKVSEITGSKLTYGTVVWKIPSGMKVHAGIVSIFTFVAALFSAILIAATSIFYSDINSSKHLKES
ncbi:hypothetical protein Pyn_39267 [Prunus yedoensis var. nudiflora]|uniref:Phosphatidylinositol-glycan biosynthesis class X protein n=1 Tax=Prunus yedoensis var. nudiflora TaxID=2094558 RepID=A0A314YA45_PRUYE|nr:hypothetical protein Pyn_39267 [Prunus yedoensis var. nudiflora]